GERREKTESNRVVIFNEGLCKIAVQYLRKASTVYLQRQLQTRTYEMQRQTHYTIEAVLQGFNSALTMLGGRGGGEGVEDRGGRGADFGSAGPMDRSSGAGRGGQGGGAAGGGRFNDEIDDEIPF